MSLSITSENYVENVLRTESKDFEAIFQRMSHPTVMRLTHAAAGMTTETGEFFDALKKHIFYGKELDKVNLQEELGDLLWYVGLAMDILGISMDEVLTKNISKLRARYPEKFTEEHATNRNLDKERQILES